MKISGINYCLVFDLYAAYIIYLHYKTLYAIKFVTFAYTIRQKACLTVSCLHSSLRIGACLANWKTTVNRKARQSVRPRDWQRYRLNHCFIVFTDLHSLHIMCYHICSVYMLSHNTYTVLV